MCSTCVENILLCLAGDSTSLLPDQATLANILGADAASIEFELVEGMSAVDCNTKQLLILVLSLLPDGAVVPAFLEPEHGDKQVFGLSTNTTRYCI